MMSKQKYVIAGAVLTLALALAACGGTSGAPAGPASGSQNLPGGTAVPPAAGVLPTAPAAAEPGGGEATGAEAALVTYTDAAQHFSLGHPGSWTQDPTVRQGVKFSGGESSVTLTFAKLPAGTDLAAYAAQDVPAATAAFPGFKQVGLAPSPDVPGAVVLGFAATAQSPVTGKTYTARGDRYYIPLTDGRVGVLTVVDPTRMYDREGVRDLALTLKATQ